MSEPSILFVSEKWAECNPAHGLSNAHHNFIGSFRATGLGAVHTFFFDEHVLNTGTRCDAALMALADRLRPDLIFMTPVRGTDINPAPETLADIRRTIDTRIVILNGDSYDDAAVRWMEGFASVVNRIVVQDCYSYYPGRARDASRYLDAWTPQDPGLYFATDEARTIDVSFIGSVANYPDRKRALGMLAEAGIDVMCGGGQAEGALSMEDYAATLRRSKIVLNFARPVFESPIFQCKGRTIEATLSGALLFEQENPETARWLTPGQHYVPFDSERDLIVKVRHYLANEDERDALAQAGRLHAMQTLSADAYWRRILSAVIPAKNAS
jgi:hypothetical protein